MRPPGLGMFGGRLAGLACPLVGYDRLMSDDNLDDDDDNKTKRPGIRHDMTRNAHDHTLRLMLLLVTSNALFLGPVVLDG